ncbi:hypothetical protein [Actinospica acidithermotolerans]|uniref:hypothetical protein n=1 Tax=Actinospica acidithermotolerans TaxID=2828514 RepID=UPI001BA6D620|nr:hypothetical protein [Actinospica acidithermotolerans]
MHEQRKQLDRASPVFALEHDLGQSDIELLFDSVRAAVARGLGIRYRASWLPYVVYAAESGYNYTGGEYWPTFERATPGWHSDHRDYIKRWYQKFADEYGGAVPTGAFATNFTIIAWPLTNAVLPKYLQRQLAELLYDFRGGLSSTLLDDPDELGTSLAVRAHSYSDRFQIFCQNTALLGQVAAALLSGENEESPYLVKSTLQRLLEGLSRERQSRQWLISAQHAASRIRAVGFGPRTSVTGIPKRERHLPTATDPKFFLRFFEGAWNPFASLPDLTPLSKSDPRVYNELKSLRGKVTGGSRPVPIGALVFGGQEITFSSWPDASKPFVQLDRSTVANAILAEKCVMTSGPYWLYRREDFGLAIEVKGRSLRPGHDYILVCEDTQEPPTLSWIEPVPLRVSGATAYRLNVPAQLTETDTMALITYGLSVHSKIFVRPAGMVASSWDGEGTVEWLAGEPAIIAIRSEFTAVHCLAYVNGNPHLIPWPEGQAELIFSLDGLDIGTHDLRVTLLGVNEQPLTQGSLAITIRDPQIRPQTATAGEGIRMLASPARPALAEIWDDRASITVSGPTDIDADLLVILRGDDGSKLVEIEQKIRLPIDHKHWAMYVKNLRNSRHFNDFYDEAESCEIVVRRDGIGMASLAAERGFQPIRWRFLKKHDGSSYARLIDRTDQGRTRIEYFKVSSPLTASLCEVSATVELISSGGLLRAKSDQLEAVSLAPTNPNDLMMTGGARPYIPHVGKSVAGVMKLVDAHRLWAGAELPADPFAVYHQHSVLEAITRANAMELCGRYWAAVEHQLEKAEEPANYLEEMQGAIGVSYGQKKLAGKIASSLYRWLEWDTLVSGFAEIIESTLWDCGVRDQPSAAKFLLTLASKPGEILEWSTSSREYLLGRVIRTPVLLRAARFSVLGTRALNGDGDE